MRTAIWFTLKIMLKILSVTLVRKFFHYSISYLFGCVKLRKEVFTQMLTEFKSLVTTFTSEPLGGHIKLSVHI